MSMPICRCPDCGCTLEAPMRWALLTKPFEPPRRVVLADFDQKTADKQSEAWVDVRCGGCSAEISLYRDHPLAAA